jgi:hypothetical protein
MQGTATPVSPTENTDFHGNLSALSFLCCSVCSVGIIKRIYICIAKFGAKEKAVSFGCVSEEIAFAHRYHFDKLLTTRSKPVDVTRKRGLKNGQQ